MPAGTNADATAGKGKASPTTPSSNTEIVSHDSLNALNSAVEKLQSAIVGAPAQFASIVEETRIPSDLARSLVNGE